MKWTLGLLLFLANVCYALDGYTASRLVKATDALAKAFPSEPFIYPLQGGFITYKRESQELDISSLIVGSQSYYDYLDSVLKILNKNVYLFTPELKNVAKYTKVALNHIAQIPDKDRSAKRHNSTIYFYDRMIKDYQKFFDLDNTTLIYPIDRNVGVDKDTPIFLDPLTLDDEDVMLTKEQVKIFSNEFSYWMMPLVPVSTTTTIVTTTTVTSTTQSEEPTDIPDDPDVPDIPLRKRNPDLEAQALRGLLSDLASDVKYDTVNGIQNLRADLGLIKGWRSAATIAMKNLSDRPNIVAGVTTTTGTVALVGGILSVTGAIPLGPTTTASIAIASGLTTLLKDSITWASKNPDPSGHTYIVEAKSLAALFENLAKSSKVFSTLKIEEKQIFTHFKGPKSPLAKIASFLKAPELGYQGNVHTVLSDIALGLANLAREDSEIGIGDSEYNENLNLALFESLFAPSPDDEQVGLFASIPFENALLAGAEKDPKRWKRIMSYSSRQMLNRELAKINSQLGTVVRFDPNEQLSAREYEGRILGIINSRQFVDELGKNTNIQQSVEKLLTCLSRCVMASGNASVEVDSIAANLLNALETQLQKSKSTMKLKQRAVLKSVYSTATHSSRSLVGPNKLKP